MDDSGGNGAGAPFLRRRFWFLLLLVAGTVLFLPALLPLLGEQPAPPGGSETTAPGSGTPALGSGTPALEGVPPALECTLLPQPTGEQFTPVARGTLPPRVVTAGSSITFSFSGGHLISNMARICGGEIVGYVYADQLPNYSDLRQVTILLDNTVIDRLTCGYDCQLAVTLPADLSPGTHLLEIRGPIGREELRFQLQVVGTPMP